MSNPSLKVGTGRSRCTQCGRYFDGASTADQHRVVAYTYALRRTARRSVERVVYEAQPPEGKWVSVGNKQFRCLTDDELTAKGLVVKPNGCWGKPWDAAADLPWPPQAASQPEPARGVPPRFCWAVR